MNLIRGYNKEWTEKEVTKHLKSGIKPFWFVIMGLSAIPLIALFKILKQ